MVMDGRTNIIDIFALNLWVNVVSKTNVVVFVLVGTLFVYFYVYPVLDPKQNIAINMVLSIMAFGGVLFFGALVAIVFAFLTSLIHLFIKGSIGHKTFEISVEHFSEFDGLRTTNIPWNDVQKTYITNSYIFIKFTRFKYFIVRRKDFLNECHYAAFYAELMRHIGDVRKN